MNQHDHEQDVIARSRQRFYTKTAAAQTQGVETSVRSVSRLLSGSIEFVEAALKEWIEQAEGKPGVRHRAVDYLKQLPAGLCSAIATKAVLNQITQPTSVTAVARDIATKLADECLYRWLKEAHPGYWHWVSTRFDSLDSSGKRRKLVSRTIHRYPPEGGVPESWPLNAKVGIGVVMLTLIEQATGYIEITDKPTGNGRKIAMVQATEDTLKWIEGCNDASALMIPMLEPCVEPPVPWISPTQGGFLSSELRQSGMVKTPSKAVVERLEQAHMPTTYTALNALQRTGWKVNMRVLEVAESFHTGQSGGPGMPPREKAQLPPQPLDIATNLEARKAWSKEASDIHRLNEEQAADRMRVAMTLNSARKFKGKDFWYVWQMDWRGRAYPQARYLHPQACDLARGLLLFAKGMPVTQAPSLRAYRIYGAGLFGQDKLTHDERDDWVQERTTFFCRQAKDPYRNTEWQDTDSPWQTLAWCIDYHLVLTNKEHLSCLPIQIDATQSGLQIMALMLKDPVAAKATNVTPSDRPQDLYQTVADGCGELSALRGKEALHQAWLRFGIDRKAVKVPVMTRVYNATEHSTMTHLGRWARDKNPAVLPKVPKAIQYLSNMVWRSMDNYLGSTTKIQRWLSEVMTLICSHRPQVPEVSWTSPLGFPVIQRYPKWNSKVLKTTVGDVIRQNRIRVERRELDVRKMVAALAPNFVHTLDAACMQLTLSKLEDAGVLQMTAIHDCFGVLAPQLWLLERSVREAYVEIFSADVLGGLHSELQAQVPDIDLPKPPTKGGLNVEDLLRSPYFFN